MKMTLSTPSVMLQIPSSYLSQLWIVGCCMKQPKSHAIKATTSLAGRIFNPASLVHNSTKEQIRKLLSNVELSVSSYDTAWVAMIPSPNSPEFPCFPECLKWLMDNQLSDGSWGLVHNVDHQSYKDILSSTLASIVALKRWNVGEHQINKGLCFIESNFFLATHKNQPSPLGFDIIFPHMLEYAKDLNIELPIKQTDLSVMLYNRGLELERCHSGEREAYMAYISEGLGNFYDRDMVMKYQMKNGSIFNSPSATAAAFMHHQNDGCINYLTSLLQKFRNGVPTVYPLDLYARLSVVDSLERLGVARIFRVEIQDVLDETYRCWVQRDEQIFKDVATCALAFRVLRTNGYEVSSDPLAESIKEGAFMSSPGEPFKDIYEALDVYRASQIIYPEEFALSEQNLRSAEFLKQKISSASNRISKQNSKEVDFALKFPFDLELERISTRRNIEHYSVNDTRILKSTYRSSNISNKSYLSLAVDDYNTCQHIYRKELKDLERWVVENRLDQLKFARQKTAYCYFSVASTLSSPELSDARMSWAKNGILTTVVDDFFDVGGSMDELVNLIQCVERWNINVDTDCCSKEVGILFLALKNAICWIAEKAYKFQSRDVTSHIAKVWLRLIKNMLTEAIWTKDGYAPTLTEYMENSHVTCALGPTVLSALYCVGPKLSEEIVLSSEYEKLYEIMSTQGRLLNDIVSFKREVKEGKLNALALYMYHGKSGIQEEEVVEEMKILIRNQRSEMRKLVLEEKGSIVPRACKDVLWSMCNVLHVFYATDDGFTENGILDNVKELIYEPLAYR